MPPSPEPKRPSRRRRARQWGTWLLVVAGLILASQLAGPAARALDRATQAPRDVAEAAVAPVSHGFRSAMDAVDPPDELVGPSLSPQQVRQLQREHRRLLRWSRYLEGQLRKAKRQVAQLSRVRQSMDLTNIQLMPAQVTAVDDRPPMRRITINRGRRHGVRPGLVVAEGFELVGRVVDAQAFTATVLWVGSGESQPFVRLMPPTAGEGPNAPARESVAHLTALPDGSGYETKIGAEAGGEPNVRVGDLAHLADEGWPDQAEGFVVGRVAKVEPWPSDPLLFRRVLVKPITPPRGLSEIVLLMPANTPEPPPMQFAEAPLR